MVSAARRVRARSSNAQCDNVAAAIAPLPRWLKRPAPWDAFPMNCAARPAACGHSSLRSQVTAPSSTITTSGRRKFSRACSSVNSAPTITMIKNEAASAA
jgi:hypothetical protein